MFDETFSNNLALDNDAFQKVYSKLHIIPAIHKFIDTIIDLAIAEERKNTLKELIREYQDNELEGKGYDFYFAIRTKLDNLLTNTK